MPSGLKNRISFYFHRSYSSRDIFVLAFGFLCIHAVINYIYLLKGYGYPYTTFLFAPLDRYGDFFKSIDIFNIVDTWDGYNPVGWSGRSFFLMYNYFFMVLIYNIGDKYVVMYSFFAICLALFAVIARQIGNKFLVIILVVLSYPMLFTLDRGNFAIMIFVFLLIALTTESIPLSTLLIAISASIRITPIVFIILVLVKEPVTINRFFRTAIYLCLWLMLLQYATELFMNGTMLNQIHHPPELADELKSYQWIYLDNWLGLPYSSSLFLPFKRVITEMSVNFTFLQSYLSYIQPIQLTAAILLVIGVLVLLKDGIVTAFNKLFTYKRFLFILCLSFVLFMPVTGDYYLLIIFLPLLLYPSNSYSFLTFITYGLLIAPKNYVIGSIYLGPLFISPQVFINPVLILTLLVAEFDLIPLMRPDPTGSHRIKGTFEIQNFVNSLIPKFALSPIHFLKRKLIYIVAIALLSWGGIFWVMRINHQAHNSEMGLPSDFDAENYLRLNPQIVDFWKSQGINETGRALVERAEIHYKEFGSKDGWKYK